MTGLVRALVPAVDQPVNFGVATTTATAGLAVVGVVAGAVVDVVDVLVVVVVGCTHAVRFRVYVEVASIGNSPSTQEVSTVMTTAPTVEPGRVPSEVALSPTGIGFGVNTGLPV